MKVTYDPYADAVYIYLTTEKHELTTLVTDDEVMVDIGSNRAVVGVEILGASSRLNLEELKTVEFEELGPPTPYIQRAEATAVHDKTSDYEPAKGE